MPPGFYTAADIPVLTVYSLSWVQYRNALAQVGREGMTQKTVLGHDKTHPAVNISLKHAEVILRTADRLGMSPAARARLEMPEENAEQGKFAGLFGGKPLRLAISNEPSSSARSSKG
jgi:P27 family predicted phage terminase small subunit